MSPQSESAEKEVTIREESGCEEERGRGRMPTKVKVKSQGVGVGEGQIEETGTKI